MSRLSTKFDPPVNRSMTVLDTSFFRKDVPLKVAYFPEPKHLGDFVKHCKRDILYKPAIKHIVPVGKSKGVLLREDVESVSDLSELTQLKVKEFGLEIQPYTMHLDYSFWKTDDILRATLPEHLLDEIPGGFSQAGHLAHLNLREEFKPYGSLIGQVILDKNPKLKTVVDKVDSIDTQFRTFKMQLLAGELDYNVEQSESGCKFRFDFSKVYWNSRLSTEHERLISQFKPHEVVCDVFAGVGPFAVPAGKKDVVVLANDLNPESFKSLKENIGINGVGKFVAPYNMDGREFIRESPHLLLALDRVIEKKKVSKKRKIDPATQQKVLVKDEQTTTVDVPVFPSHYVMNLPDSALTFLDEFVGLYSDPEVKATVKAAPGFKLPTIHTHCFEKYSPQEPEPSIEELHRRVAARMSKIMGHEIKAEDCNFHLVRKVAPTKPMFCVSFVLPEEVAFRERKN